MNRACQKGVLSLFTDKNRQTNVKTGYSNGLLLWTPIPIALTVFRSEFSITNGLPRSRRVEDRQTKVREDRQIYKATSHPIFIQIRINLGGVCYGCYSSTKD
jgi:hypothetical protein